MPVTITKKPKPQPEPAKVEVVEGGRPKLSKVINLGDWRILPDMDVHDESGRIKFLVHLTKASQVFRIKAYDEENKELKCITGKNTVFDTKLYGSTSRFYMVVATVDLNATTVPDEVVKAVQDLMLGVAA